MQTALTLPRQELAFQEVNIEPNLEVPPSQEVIDAAFKDIIADLEDAVPAEVKEQTSNEHFAYKLGGKADDDNGFGAKHPDA